jgi:transcriptional regulator with XRE-family HTH domain
VELATPLPHHDISPLASLRLQRQLPLRELVGRSGLTEEEISWLEEGRVYRFRSADDALLALLLYATALGVSHAEARRLAGLPVPPRLLRGNPKGRLAVLGGLAASLVALVAGFALPGGSGGSAVASPSGRAAEAGSPPPWQIEVDVLNGAGDMNWTNSVASRIGGMAYRIRRVRRADRFDYPRTIVFYEAGGQANAVRLARRLGVTTRPLPGGTNPKRLVVVVGPHRGPR